MTTAQLPLEMLKRVERAQVKTRRSFPLRTPIDGSAFAEAPDCGADDARRAADVAYEAFASWKMTTAYERSAILRRWNTLIAQNEPDGAPDGVRDG